MNQPSVGRIVHFHSPDGSRTEARAAMITELHWSDAADEEDWQGVEQPADSGDDQAEDYISAVSLAVLNPTGMFFNENVPFSPVPAPGHWSWPPRT